MKGDNGRLPFTEWVCATHWPKVSAKKRAAKAAAERALRQAALAGRDLEPFQIACAETWVAARNEAIETAVGI